MRLRRSFVMHFVVVAPLTSLASPISNNYTVRIASHGSRDPDRSEAGRSWRRADTAAAFASRLQEETKENKRKLQQHVYGAGGGGGRKTYRASGIVDSVAPPSHARCAGRPQRRTAKWQPADKYRCLSRPQCTTNHRRS